MFFGFRFLSRVAFFILILVAPFNLARAAWWDGEDLPVPPNAGEDKRETRKISGTEFEFAYYSSTQSASQTREFYQTRLPQLGWNRKELIKDLSQLQAPEGQAVNMEYVNKALESNLFFEKGDENLIITFMPEDASQNGKVKFALCRGKKIQAARMMADKVTVPELVAKPKKDVYPVYPDAALVSLSEDARSLRTTYFIKEEIEPVAAFYKTRMSEYGWSLTAERPISKINKGDVKNPGSDSCPSCAKAEALLGVSLETWSTEMDFGDARGNTCHIMVAQVVPGDEKHKSLGMTTIVVDYEEKIR